jgi:hypothetical protein
MTQKSPLVGDKAKPWQAPQLLAGGFAVSELFARKLGRRSPAGLILRQSLKAFEKSSGSFSGFVCAEELDHRDYERARREVEPLSRRPEKC